MTDLGHVSLVDLRSRRVTKAQLVDYIEDLRDQTASQNEIDTRRKRENESLRAGTRALQKNLEELQQDRDTTVERFETLQERVTELQEGFLDRDAAILQHKALLGDLAFLLMVDEEGPAHTSIKKHAPNRRPISIIRSTASYLLQTDAFNRGCAAALIDHIPKETP